MGSPMGGEDQNRVLYKLCGMIIHILGSPPLPIPFPTPFTQSSSAIASSSSSSSSSSQQVSPAAFATLFLGISLALMLFGSAIFLIGFILLPWVVALVFLFYFAAILSNLSHLGRAFLSPTYSSPISNACKLS